MPIDGKPLDGRVKLADLLKYGLETSPDEPAVVSLRKKYSWRGLDDESARLASGLLSLGLEPGDRVASLIPNRCELLVYYIACMKAGLVSVPLNYRYMPPEIDHALEVSGARLIVAHSERVDDLNESRLAPGLDLGAVHYGPGVGGHRHFDDLLSGAPAPSELPGLPEASPAFIFFTSGSTGPAKGVTHTYESLSYMFASTSQGFEITSSDVMLADSSMSHIGAFMFSLCALSLGARALVATNTEPAELLTLMRRERPSVLCILPAALFKVIRGHNASAGDFSSLRLLRSGSDKVPLELEHEFTELTGLAIDEGYGCSEIGLATINPPSGLIKAGSVGLPLPGFSFSIRGDGGELPHGEDGLLWAKTGSLMSGYWDNPESTAEVMDGGWFNTGDLMRADADGYLSFRGRKKQLIVHDGSNISPQEVEEALLEHHAVESAGAIGIHDLMHGENVRVYVCLKDGAPEPTSVELIEFAKKRIGYKAPEEIVFLEEIPLNPTGKVDRVTLKKMAEEQAHG